MSCSSSSASSNPSTQKSYLSFEAALKASDAEPVSSTSNLFNRRYSLSTTPTFGSDNVRSILFMSPSFILRSYIGSTSMVMSVPLHGPRLFTYRSSASSISLAFAYDAEASIFSVSWRM